MSPLRIAGVLFFLFVFALLGLVGLALLQPNWLGGLVEGLFEEKISEMNVSLATATLRAVPEDAPRRYDLEAKLQGHGLDWWSAYWDHYRETRLGRADSLSVLTWMASSSMDFPEMGTLRRFQSAQLRLALNGDDENRRRATEAAEEIAQALSEDHRDITDRLLELDWELQHRALNAELPADPWKPLFECFEEAIEAANAASLNPGD